MIHNKALTRALLLAGSIVLAADGKSDTVASLSSAYASATKPITACDINALRPLPDVRLIQVMQVAVPVAHCKVSGVIGPEIHFELLLPDTWNGKFAMGGGGGFVGSVMNTSLMYGSLQAGYATVGTDTGHQGHPLDASWALDNLERLVNFGHQAVHRTAVTAKALIKDYYDSDISRSYFTGCSRGGGQGLMAAQRYPEDFDGIVAGAPAHNWTGLAALATQITRAMYPDPDDLQKALVGPAEKELIQSSYLAMCDARDGITDGILNDPRQCDFDVTTLLCNAEKTDSCLSPEQVAALNVIYEGPKDSQGNALYYGFPFGGGTALGGWARWLTGGLKYQADMDEFQGGVDTGEFEAPVAPSAFYGFGNGIMKYFVYNDPEWSYADYDYDNLANDSRRVGETLNATSPDLSAFRNRGGKLIIYSGWSDAAAPGNAFVAYHEDLLEFDATAAEDVRLFMMPGVEHCFGGPGPSWVNYLTEIDNWVESGDAPDQVTAYWLDEAMQPAGSRPVCAYPEVAQYDSEGDTRDVASFKCAAAH